MLQISFVNLTTTKSNKDLVTLIDSINTNEDDSVVNNAVIKTVISVGQRLLRNEVTLLSTVHDIFCLHATEIDLSVHVSQAKELTTARCLL